MRFRRFGFFGVITVKACVFYVAGHFFLLRFRRRGNFLFCHFTAHTLAFLVSVYYLAGNEIRGKRLGSRNVYGRKRRFFALDYGFRRDRRSEIIALIFIVGIEQYFLCLFVSVRTFESFARVVFFVAFGRVVVIGLRRISIASGRDDRTYEKSVVSHLKVVRAEIVRGRERGNLLVVKSGFHVGFFLLFSENRKAEHDRKKDRNRVDHVRKNRSENGVNRIRQKTEQHAADGVFACVNLSLVSGKTIAEKARARSLMRNRNNENRNEHAGSYNGGTDVGFYTPYLYYAEYEQAY